ncbi:hypothetical protein J5N97_020471 [Dioscorea zingiberensis]|uniref:Uncharacterized protein n=1 Tax=Dioscorea zingiberensis TaxID=325984 RepID=A0A9D5HDP5_9LILI|nr:hypothetical protein J5N97_020471 [Dioscorea zingiberensis]
MSSGRSNSPTMHRGISPLRDLQLKLDQMGPPPRLAGVSSYSIYRTSTCNCDAEVSVGKLGAIFGGSDAGAAERDFIFSAGLEGRAEEVTAEDGSASGGGDGGHDLAGCWSYKDANDACRRELSFFRYNYYMTIIDEESDYIKEFATYKDSKVISAPETWLDLRIKGSQLSQYFRRKCKHTPKGLFSYPAEIRSTRYSMHWVSGGSQELMARAP